MLQELCINNTYHSGRWRNASKLPWLQNEMGDSLSEKVWNILNEGKRPKCWCGNWTSYLDSIHGYRESCSSKCSQTSDKMFAFKSERHKSLWADPKWKAKTSKKMASAHFDNRAGAKLTKLEEKGITCLDEMEPGMMNEYHWKHRCGEVFVKPFTRVTSIWCPICHVSRGQGELYEAIRAIYKGKIIVNDRTALKPKEIDIYLPDIKLGFEYNGEYWHPGDGSREAGKIEYAASKGIRLIEVWEQDWKRKRATVWKSIKAWLK